MRGQFIDLPPDSASLPRQAAGPQLWPMSGLFLLDVYGSELIGRIFLRLKGGFFLNPSFEVEAWNRSFFRALSAFKFKRVVVVVVVARLRKNSFNLQRNKVRIDSASEGRKIFFSKIRILNTKRERAWLQYMPLIKSTSVLFNEGLTSAN